MNSSDLIALALSCGASGAVLLPRASLVTSPMFRDICKSNGCGQYGRCWVCPPEIGEIDALKGKISRMKREIMEYKLSRIEYTEGNLVLFDDEGDMLSLRNLVNEAKKLCGGICACFSGSDEIGYKYII